MYVYAHNISTNTFDLPTAVKMAKFLDIDHLIYICIYIIVYVNIHKYLPNCVCDVDSGNPCAFILNVIQRHLLIHSRTLQIPKQSNQNNTEWSSNTWLFYSSCFTVSYIDDFDICI